MAEQNSEPSQATGPLAGEPRRRRGRPPVRSAGRVASWFAWWVLMTSFWVAIDDSLRSDELLAGAGAAALGALAALAVTYRAATLFRMRARWLVPALRLPAQVAQDTLTVFGALVRTLVTSEPPRGEFAEVPVRYGDDTPLGVTRRVLLTGECSLAPNTFVLGIDGGRDVMVVHRLVTKE